MIYLKYEEYEENSKIYINNNVMCKLYYKRKRKRENNK